MTIVDLITCEKLEERLAVLHQASMELIQDVLVDSLLERIALIACEQAEARYGALGVNDGGHGFDAHKWSN